MSKKTNPLYASPLILSLGLIATMILVILLSIPKLTLNQMSLSQPTTVNALYQGEASGSLGGRVTITSCISTTCNTLDDVGATVEICPVSKGKIVWNGKIKTLVCQSRYLIETQTGPVGNYKIPLSPKKYFVSMALTPPETANVPSEVTITSKQATIFNINIDSGTR